MNEGFTLVDFGKIAKPVNTLIQVVSKGLGFTAGPWVDWINSTARARARLSEARSEEEVKDIHWRAEARRKYIDVRRQGNAESVLIESLPYINGDAKPEDIDEDWLHIFFDKSQKFSDSEMQNLWGRILAGEANMPGKFSKRTLSIVENIDGKTAQSFSELANFSVDQGIIFVFDVEDYIYSSNGVLFSNLKNLDSFGLISFDHTQGFALSPKDKNWGLEISYFGDNFKLVRGNTGRISIGQVLASDPGEQLLSVCGRTEMKGFKEYLRQKFSKNIV